MPAGSSVTLRAAAPDPEVPVMVTRRQFTVEYRRRIVCQADATRICSLQVILERYSRYVWGWMVATHENARLTQRLIEATWLTQGPHPLTIHADRGRRCAARSSSKLFADLSIEESHSRA